jgi:hypothetical protein
MKTEIICGIEFKVVNGAFPYLLAKINDSYSLRINGDETIGYDCCCPDWKVPVSSTGKSKEEAVSHALVNLRKFCLEQNKALNDLIITNVDCVIVIDSITS